MNVLDVTRMVEAVGALGIVLALLVLGALVLRHWRQRTGGLGTQRLALVETLALDARHRLVRVRDGEKEHLVLLGSATPVVVDRQPVTAGDRP